MLIAIGNSQDASLAKEAERLLSDGNPVVRGAAVWALSQLISPGEFEALARRYGEAECDDVRTEWLGFPPPPGEAIGQTKGRPEGRPIVDPISQT